MRKVECGLRQAQTRQGGNAECGSDWNAAFDKLRRGKVGMRNAAFDKLRRGKVGKSEPQNQITANRRTEEYRMSNVEGMYSARREPLCRTVYLIKKTERAYSGYVATKAGSHSTLLHFGTHR
jgi:hypothetical protein